MRRVIDEPAPLDALCDVERWAVVRDRDERYDGAFIYGVTSTGIYCRPSCGSRRPRRDRVMYFAGPTEAEADGFRPCKRCRPNVKGPSQSARTVEHARQYLTEHLDEPVTLAELAEEMGLSVTHLHRVFKKTVGLTPREYQDAVRMDRFKGEVREGRTVSRATFEAGFGSSRALYDKAIQGLGMTPGAYRAGGRGITIRMRVARTPVGVLLLAATRTGVCFVSLGDSEREVENQLRGEYPNATVVDDDGRLAMWIDAIVAEIRGMPDEADVPIDLVGTEFQKCVWRAIRSIPRGETRTYGEVAKCLGNPRAARAVAGACAANRIALFVPCHRVVRGNGDPGGYRWGRARKERILDLEKANPAHGAGSDRVR
jgi:AraC family transcriptional regulator of adaptative response/methylated-DNA-[protein]-cysteine methyltransferase